MKASTRIQVRESNYLSGKKKNLFSTASPERAVGIHPEIYIYSKEKRISLVCHVSYLYCATILYKIHFNQ